MKNLTQDFSALWASWMYPIRHLVSLGYNMGVEMSRDPVHVELSLLILVYYNAFFVLISLKVFGESLDNSLQRKISSYRTNLPSFVEIRLKIGEISTITLVAMVKSFP